MTNTSWSLETPKNLLIKARRRGRRSDQAEEELMSLIVDLDYAPALYRYLNDLDDAEDQGTSKHYDNE